MKKAGTYLTPAQLKAKKDFEAKRAAMVASGQIKEGEDAPEEGDQKKGSMIKKNKKDKKKWVKPEEKAVPAEDDKAQDADEGEKKE